MVSRLELQTMLEDILGSRNVYYQPPSSVTMNYPAIVYAIDGIDNSFANNQVYSQSYSYQITVMAEDPDSEIVETISKLPKCRYVRQFASDGLNHTIFKLFF